MIFSPLNYVLDANVFIEAARRYYSFDIAPPFWNFLKSQAQLNIMGSIDKVYDEILKGDDKLKDWSIKEFSPYYYSSQTQKVFSSYQIIVQHAQSDSQYNQRAKDVFMEASNADTWILAYAHAHRVKIVTHETLDRNVKKRIPIPNICEDFGLPYCDTFEMLKNSGFRF